MWKNHIIRLYEIKMLNNQLKTTTTTITMKSIVNIGCFSIL